MRMALALGSAIAALAMVEGAVRVAAPAYNPTGRVAFTRLPDGTPIGPPNAVRRQIRNTGDYDVLVRFNQWGLRDPKPLAKSTADSVAVVGDSFAFGWGVEESQRFSDVLQAKLGRPVYNLGAGLADLDGYDRLLHYAESNGLRSGTLVVSVCMENDIREYGPGESGQWDQPPLPATKNFLTDHSAAYGVIATAIRRSPWIERAAARAGLVVPSLAAVAESDPGDEAVQSSAVRLRQLVSGRHAVVLIVPSRALWTGTAGQRRQAGHTHDTFVRWLREAGLTVVDVRAAFEQRGSPLGLHFPNDGHWTAEGHRIAGEALADAIERSVRLQPDVRLKADATGAREGAPDSASTSVPPPAR